jgi:hypothetical protein
MTRNYAKELGMRLMSSSEKTQKGLPYYASKNWTLRRQGIQNRIARQIIQTQKRKVARMEYARKNDIPYYQVSNAMAGVA